MAKRKSFVAQVWAEHQKAVAQRERERRQAEAAESKAARAAELAAERAEKAAERREQQREREAERRAALRAKEAERRAVLKEKELQRAEMQKERDAERRAVQKEREAARRAEQRERDAQRKAADRVKEAEARAVAKEKEADRRRLAAEREKARKESERERRAEQQSRERLVAAEAKARHDAATRAAELKRGAAREAKELQQRERDLIVRQAQIRTQTVEGRRAELTGLLAGYRANGAGEPSVLKIPDVTERVAAHIRTQTYPSDLSLEVGAALRSEDRELLIERELPSKSIIPLVKAYRVIKGDVRPVPLKPDEMHDAYSGLLARLALRTLAEAFDATADWEVERVLLNAYVTAVDPGTGQMTRPCLVSVQMTRDFFGTLDISHEEFDAKECLKRCDALISDHPHDLVPVKPILAYSLERFKIIAGMDIALDLDSRLDLLTLKPYEFENLIKQLFAARGLRSWQTQESRDEGVDAVVINEDPITGGVVIIQAKRYAHVVSYESITALAGVMHDKKAVRGILVTTSWAGAAGHRFAEQNRIQIIEAPELKQQLKQYLNMDVLVSLPVIPRNWKRSDVA